MKTIRIEQSDLETCIQEAQADRVIVTRDGSPVAVVIGLESMDEEQRSLSQNREFWELIQQRRQQPTVSRAELEQNIEARRAKTVGTHETGT